MINEKIKMYKITLLYNERPQGSYIENNLLNLVDVLLNDAELGETYRIEVIEMSLDEHAKLPDFEGF